MSTVAYTPPRPAAPNLRTINLVSDFGAKTDGSDIGPAFRAAVAFCVTSGIRDIFFPGDGDAGAETTAGYNLTSNVTIPAMPPAHTGGPSEPLKIHGSGYGNTLIEGTASITTLTPLIVEDLQFYVNLAVSYVGGPATYANHFSRVGFVGTSIFPVGNNFRGIFTACTFYSGVGGGPICNLGSAAGNTYKVYFANCLFDCSYVAWGAPAFTLAEITIAGGSSGSGGGPFLSLTDGSGTVTLAKVTACAGIADQPVAAFSLLHKFSRRLSNAAAGNDYPVAATAWAFVDPTNLVWSLAAAVGDVLEGAINTAWSAQTNEGYLDFATSVAGVITNQFSGTGAAGSGPYGWLGANVSTGNSPASGTVRYTVQAGDIVAGRVSAGPIFRVSTAVSRVLYARATIELFASLTNLGPVAA